MVYLAADMRVGTLVIPDRNSRWDFGDNITLTVTGSRQMYLGNVKNGMCTSNHAVIIDGPDHVIHEREYHGSRDYAGDIELRTGIFGGADGWIMTDDFLHLIPDMPGGGLMAPFRSIFFLDLVQRICPISHAARSPVG